MPETSLSDELINGIQNAERGGPLPPDPNHRIVRDERGKIVSSTGRKKGSVNRVNKTVRETLLDVFNDLQADPVNKLSSWAKTEPTEFYRMAAKLIPLEISGSLTHIIEIARKQDTDEYADDHDKLRQQHLPARLPPPE